jgi:hypothetical protein
MAAAVMMHTIASKKFTPKGPDTVRVLPLQGGNRWLAGTYSQGVARRCRWADEFLRLWRVIQTHSTKTMDDIAAAEREN